MNVKIIIDTGKCNLCKTCIYHCPSGVFETTDRGIIVDSSRCIECYGCIPLCPQNAISIILEDETLEKYFYDKAR